MSHKVSKKLINLAFKNEMSLKIINPASKAPALIARLVLDLVKTSVTSLCKVPTLADSEEKSDILFFSYGQWTG
jgi:hypothetical protein